MEKVEKRRKGGDKHKEVKLVHEVKQEVYFCFVCTSSTITTNNNTSEENY